MQTLYKRDLDVIIPVYNLEHHITPMIESLKAQDTGDYNVGITFVLNNCTDNTESVIRESGLYCTVMNCEIQGCGPARNAALDMSTAEYIWMMDGDDWLLSDTAIRQALDKAHGNDIIRIPFKSNKFYWSYFSMVWQYVIRRKFIGDLRFPAYQPAEDDAFTEILLRLAGFSKYSHTELPCTAEPLYFYNYLREGSNMWRVARGEKI